jgi:RNA polymerase primary sigma factor
MKEQTRRRFEVLNSVDPITAYCHDIRDSNKLTTAQEKALAARIRAGDRRALNELVQANLKFVVAVSRQYENRGLPLIDLISEGNLGLIRAAERFDSNVECRFISYAVWYIRQGLTQALADQTRAVRLTTSTATRLHQLAKASQRLSQRLGREPSLEELELETGMHSGRIRTYMMLMASELSLDREGADSLESGSLEGSEAGVEAFHGKRALTHLLNGLDAREREVLDLYYGLKHGEAFNLPQMAKMLGISKERVRQIKEMSVAKLKKLFLLSSKYPCLPLDRSAAKPN